MAEFKKSITGWAHAKAAALGGGGTTALLGTRAIGDYLAWQRKRGWPGSVSIHNKTLRKVKAEAAE